MLLNGNRILVKEIKEEAKTATGILLSTTQETFKKGEVVFTGPGVYQDGVFVPNKTHVGTKVLFPKGQDVVINGEDYQLVNDESIIATLK